MGLEELSNKELIELAEFHNPAGYEMIQREFARRAIIETAYDASQDVYVNPPEAVISWTTDYDADSGYVRGKN